MLCLHLLFKQGVEIVVCGLVAKVLEETVEKKRLWQYSTGQFCLSIVKQMLQPEKNNSELSKSQASETSLTLRIEQPHSVNTHSLTITLNTHAHTH